MALVASGRTTGEWPKCLNPLKRSALEDSSADIKEQFTLLDETPEDAAAGDEVRRREDQRGGKLVLVGGAGDEMLHYLAYQNQEERKSRLRQGQPRGGRVPRDPGEEEMTAVALREHIKELREWMRSMPAAEYAVQLARTRS